jgi:hypothetical protein
MYIYINKKFLQKRPNNNPMAWYEKNMLFKNLMSNVDESVDESDSSDENPIVLDEPDEDEVEHDPFESLHDDEILFSRL